jgi:hypothetical protein
MIKINFSNIALKTGFTILGIGKIDYISKLTKKLLYILNCQHKISKFLQH